MTTPTRRDCLTTLAGATIAGLGLASAPALAADSSTPVAKNGRIHQSLVHWCYSGHFKDFDALCEAAMKLGCQSIELCGVEHWPTSGHHDRRLVVRIGLVDAQRRVCQQRLDNLARAFAQGQEERADTLLAERIGVDTLRKQLGHAASVVDLDSSEEVSLWVCSYLRSTSYDK